MKVKTSFVAAGIATLSVIAASGLLLRAQGSHAVGTWAAAGSAASDHSGGASVALENGRTLIAGGLDAEGAPTDIVRIFNPGTNGATTAGHLRAARDGHTAALLADGRILIAGGRIDGAATADLEIFNPATGTSSAAGALGAPRSSAAAAALSDGTVLIVGGWDADGNALRSAEVFNPTTGTTAAVPAQMLRARAGASATTLLDGRVLIAGGNNGATDVSSAEIYDPGSQTFDLTGTAMSVARSGHTAVLLPDNGSVLIAGGGSNGAAQSGADLFLPAEFPDPFTYGEGSFAATGAMANARAYGVSGPGHAEGYAYATGGGSRAVERYRFATIKTDKDDYAPGERAVITGTGWQPGEQVRLLFQEDPAVHDDYVLNVTADENGNIFWDQWAPEDHDLGVRFYLIAHGSASRAQTTFTDGVVALSIASPTTTTPVTISAVPANVTVAFDYRTNGSGGTQTATARIKSGATVIVSVSKTVARANGADGGSDTITVTLPAGTTSGSFDVEVTLTDSGTGNPPSMTTSQPNAVNFSAGPTKLVFTNSAFSGAVNTCLGPFTVQSQNSSNVATNVTATTTVNLTTNGAGAFYGDAACSTAAVTTRTISNGTDTTGSFYYEPTAVGTGSHLLTASASGLTSATQTQTVGKAETTTTITCSAGPFVYNGSPHTPCSATVTGPGGLNEPVTVTYENNVNAGTATATATYTETTNYLGSNDSEEFTIDKAPTETAVTCSAGPFVYNGSPHTPCSATVTGPGGLDEPVTVTYENNVNAGTATATASYAEAANYLGSNDSEEFTIGKAPTETAVTCSAGPFVYNGSPHTPCSATVTGPGGLDEPVTVTYENNVNAGTATATASYAETANYLGSSDSEEFTIGKAPTETSVTCSVGPFVYSGSPHTPCTATVTGPGGLSQSLTVTYENNVNAGTATATASYAETANYLGSSDSEEFTIGKATPSFSNLSSPSIILGTSSTTLSGTVKANDLVPPGSVSITVNGVTQTAPIQADGSFSATFNTGALTVSGSPYAITYAYTATQNFGSATGNGSITVTYDFTGFFRPVENRDLNQKLILNQVKAGSAVPVKFSLHGYRGMNILFQDTPTWPRSILIACDTTAVVDNVEETLTAGNSSISYDALVDQYVYVWKTEKSWTGCRQLQVKLADGTLHVANFKFTR